MSDRVSIVSIVRVNHGRSQTDQDLVAAEAPVSIRLHQAQSSLPRPFGVLMRTPGHDEDLVPASPTPRA